MPNRNEGQLSKHEVKVFDHVNEATCFFARRCDVTGKGINQGIIWRLGGVVTALGAPSEQQAHKYGFDSLQHAQNNGAAAFKAWTDADDIKYKSNEDGQLQTLDGQPVPSMEHDSLDEIVRLLCLNLDSADLDALKRCVSFGAQVMRERARQAQGFDKSTFTAQSDRASAIAGRLLCLAVTSEDYT